MCKLLYYTHEGLFMCKGRVTLRCPNCNWQLEVTRPDSVHPSFSLGKPQENEVQGNIVEEVYNCKNPRCNAKITVYWYEAKLFLDRG